MSPVARAPELPPVIVGTAGHVDHGKTSLVKMLTGCDTDRLPEEKQRGMSINLGFAPCLLPGNRLVGIVDVPGHIDFIRNMVAGASTIDVLILVVAADDGIMPQTREHLQIVKLLGARRLMAALTKVDLVDGETRGLALSELKEFLSEEGFPDAPAVPVSNVTLDGISEIREVLDALVGSVEREADRRVFRMNVERSFSVKGLGAVASGVPVSGRLEAGAKLEILPAGKMTGVRSIQSYKRESGHAVAHVCAALNLRDVEAGEIGRGVTLAEPGFFKPETAAIAILRNISVSKAIRHNSEFRFHSGTMEAAAKAGLLEGVSLPPGAFGIARLKFQEPLALAQGDKFILRSPSPSETLGGGDVLFPCDFGAKRTSSQLRARLAAAAGRLRGGDLFGCALLAAPQPILSVEDALRISGCLREHAEAELKAKVDSGFLASLGDGFVFVRERAGETASSISKLLDKYHRRHRHSFGLALDAAAHALGLKTASLQKLLAILPEKEGRFSVAFGRLALASFKPAINKSQLIAKEALSSLLRSCGTKAPSRGDILKALGLQERDYEVAVAALLEESVAVAFGNHVMELPSFEKCKSIAQALFKRDGHIDISAFKEAAGTGRNLSVAILEKFDSVGLTRRSGDRRIYIAPIEKA